MSLLLTHGYFLFEDEIEQKILKPYPPLGLLYISAYLNEKAVEHLVFDTTFSTEEEWWNFVLEKRPTLIAFYVNLMTKVKIIQLISKIKQTSGLEEIKIVLGGPDITYNQDNYLSAGVDFLIIGEGEETLKELSIALKNERALDQINGLVYTIKGEKFVNSPREKIKDLDALPPPNRAAIPIQKYLDCWKSAHGKSALNVSTQRGCPYTCKWCSTAVYGQSYRRKSPMAVVAELADLMATYQPDSFWFVDDVFTVSHKWIRGFRDALIAADLTIQYECITRAERLDDEIIDILKSTGCIRVWIGAESGSQKVIDAMDRRVDVNLVRDQLIAAREKGIETGTFIMVGYPSETYEDILITANYLKAAMPDQFTITKSYPIKGTQLYTDVESNINVKPDWFTSTDRDLDFKRPYSSRFYRFAIRYIYNTVALQKEKNNKRIKIITLLKTWISALVLKILSLNESK